MTTGQIILAIVAIISFVAGRFYGRSTLYEDVIRHAHWMENMVTTTIMTDYKLVNKPFHWGTELLPNYFYYGINFFGLKLGYTKTVVKNATPIPPFAQR